MSPNRDFTMDLTKRGHFGGPILDPPPGGVLRGGSFWGVLKSTPKGSFWTPPPATTVESRNPCLEADFDNEIAPPGQKPRTRSFSTPDLGVSPNGVEKLSGSRSLSNHNELLLSCAVDGFHPK